MPSTELQRRVSGAESHQETPDEIDILDLDLELELACQLRSLDSAALQFVDCRQETEKALRDLAEYLRKHHANAQAAKVAGSSAGLVGSIMVIGGFVGSFFTFGASLAVSAIGAGVGVVGGLTTVGGISAEVITEKITESRAKQVLEEDIKACQGFNEAIGRVKSTWQDVNKVMLGVGRTAGVVGHGIGVTGGVVQAGVQAIRMGRAAGQTAFETASVLGRGLAITGAAFALVAVPIDVYTLVTSAVKISKKSVPKLVEEITTAADELYCPSEKEMKECMSRIRDEFSLYLGRQQ